MLPHGWISKHSTGKKSHTPHGLPLQSRLAWSSLCSWGTSRSVLFLPLPPECGIKVVCYHHPVGINFLQPTFNKGSTFPLAHHPVDVVGGKVKKVWEKWTCSAIILWEQAWSSLLVVQTHRNINNYLTTPVLLRGKHQAQTCSWSSVLNKW